MLLTLIAMMFCITAVWQIDRHISLARQKKNIQQLNTSLEHVLKVVFQIHL